MASPSMPPAPSHPLALKVLRASRPTLQPSPSPASASPCLVLPAAFGAIYLGEHFAGLLALSVLPTHTEPVLRPVLRVDLLPPTRANKIPLGAVDAPVLHPRRPAPSQPTPAGGETSTHARQASWTEGDGLELAVTHEMTELGLHTLSCTVSYDELIDPSTSATLLRPPSTSDDLLSAESEAQAVGAGRSLVDSDSLARTTRTFRKLYKFQVLNPLSVKTKLFSPALVPSTPSQLASHTNASLAPSGTAAAGRSYLEVQIQNQTASGLVFGRLALETGALAPEAARVRGAVGRGDAAQTVFSIPAGPAPLGRLALAWTGPMGEPGQLKTSPLAGLPPAPAAPLLVHTRPARVPLGRPFTVLFSLPRAPHLDLVPLESSLSVAVGQSPLLPLSTHEDGRVSYKLTRVPIETGLIEVAGVLGIEKHQRNVAERWESLGYIWCEKVE